MVEAGREFGVYADGHSDPVPDLTPLPVPEQPDPRVVPPAGAVRRPPGVVTPWSEQREQLGSIPGNEALCHDVWSNVDSLAYMFVYQVLLSF